MVIPTTFEDEPDRKTGPYQTLPSDSFVRNGLSLRAVDPRDIETIRLWRNAQMDVLRQSAEISPEAQINYFEAQVWPDKRRASPRQILFALEQDSRFIGYGGLVYIDWTAQRAEVSFLLEPELEKQAEVRATIFVNFLELMQVVAFNELHLNRLYTETYASRHRHINSLETAGFKLEGTLREHVTIDDRKVDSLMHGIIASDK